jgi:hypothetical protein
MNEVSKSPSENALKDIKEKIIKEHGESFAFECVEYVGGFVVKVKVINEIPVQESGLETLAENIIIIAETYGLDCATTFQNDTCLVSCTSMV